MDLMVIITLAVSLFFILDPFASLPVFMSITRGRDEKLIKSYANKAAIVAAILLFVFMFVGPDLMKIFGVTMESFRTAGGIILILMAIEIVFGLKLSTIDDESDAPWVIIATPILSGPGVITAAILFSNQYDIISVMIAGSIALLITWVMLRMAPTIMKYAGEQTMGILSKIIGLLLAAMGIEYIFSGASEWFRQYGADAVASIIPHITQFFGF